MLHQHELIAAHSGDRLGCCDLARQLRVITEAEHP